MTKEEFWEALDAAWQSDNREQFWQLWHANNEYIRQWLEDVDKKMADPNTSLRQEHDKWWADLKPKLIAELGEDWVNENCRD